MRSKKALYNSASHLIMEGVSVLCSFILPRVILSAFGSTYNGLIASITQFLSAIILFQAGVGGVTRAALYKPLAENDQARIDSIIRATEIFIRKAVCIFAGVLLFFALLYPFLLSESFGYIFTGSLVLIMGFSTVVQYYFSITYWYLLVADQRRYVIAVIQIITLILNLLTVVLLIRLGCGIHVVKFGSALVQCIIPIATIMYIRRKYSLNRNAEPDTSALSQRWDAFIHELSAFVQENTDVMILTIRSTVKSISVYSVYFMVANGIRKLMASLTAGLEAVFGNMYALGDREGLRKNLQRVEFVLFSVSTVVYSCLFVLIVPFVTLYTSDITDADYVQPVLAVVLVAAQFVSCIRTPYLNLVDAAGHYRQTKRSALAECVLKITISIITVGWFGLAGVALGTLVSTLYRAVYLSAYASKHILQCKNGGFYKRFFISAANIALVYLFMEKICAIRITGVGEWLLCAVITGTLSGMLVLLSAMFWDRELLRDCCCKLLYTLRPQKK